jgi:hypothetical protein
VAVAHVQNASVEGGSLAASQTATFGSSTSSGNLVAVTVAWGNSGGQTAPTISDNKGNTYTKLKEQSATASDAVAIYVAKNITGGASHQVTATSNGGTAFISMGIIELSGADTATQAGATNSGSGAGPDTAPSAGSVTPASGDMAVCVLSHNFANSPSLTAGTGWTRRTNVVGNTGVACGSETQAGTGASVSGDWTTGSGVSNWAAAVAVIQVASGGGGGGPWPFFFESELSGHCWHGGL